jgi:hypothetical protein
MRLDAYLAEVKVTSQTDSSLLKKRAELAARSLGIKLEQQCFDKPSDQQAPCLVAAHGGSGSGRRQRAIAGGAADQRFNGDLMNQLSYSALGRRRRLQPLRRRHRGYGQDPFSHCTPRTSSTFPRWRCRPRTR